MSFYACDPASRDSKVVSRNHRRVSAAIALALLCSTAPALATPTDWNSAPRPFNIPAQDMETALLSFARTVGIQLVVNPGDLRGMQAPELVGRYAPADALTRMLRRSRLSYEWTGPNTLAIKARPLMQPAAYRPQAAAATPTALPVESEAVAEEVVDSDIVVTAQRRAQRLQDVPISVTVTSGETLARGNVVSLQDLSVRLPNVRITPAPGAGLLNIRGVGSGLNPGFEQAVGTFVDGVYRGRSRAIAAALFDLERIEVLKGPQTTFFGNNTIAGALNVTTRKPGWDFAFNASALYAPVDKEYALEAGMTLPLSDTISVRGAIRSFGMDGFVSNAQTGRDEPHQRNLVTRGSIVWEPSDMFRSETRVDYGRLREHGSFNNELAGCAPDSIYGAPTGLCLRYLNTDPNADGDFDFRSSKPDAPQRYDFVEVASTNSIEFGAHKLTSVTGYFHHKQSLLTHAAPLPLLGTGGTASPFQINQLERMTQFSQELRLESTNRGFLTYMVGAYYSHGDLDLDGYTGYYFGPFGVFAAPTYGPTTPIASHGIFEQKDRTLSAFGSAALNFTDRITLNLGARYSVVRKTVGARDWIFGTGGSIAGPDSFTPGPDSVQAPLAAVLGGARGNFTDPRRTDKKFMPSVNLQYRPTGDITTYLSYSKGFKAGGYGAVVPGKPTFGPETVDAYEAGIKGYVLDRRLFLSLAVYRSEYKDLQESTNNILPSGAIIPVLGNVGKARAQGIEFGMNWKLAEFVRLTGDVAYLDAKYLRYPNAPCTALGNIVPNCVQDMDGKRRAYAPKFSGNVGLSFQAPFDGMLVRFDPSLYFTSRYYQSATADPLLEQEGFAKLDARISISTPDERWEFAIIGKNLTDRKTASFRNIVPTSPGTYYVLPERPRAVALQVSVKY